MDSKDARPVLNGLNANAVILGSVALVLASIFWLSDVVRPYGVNALGNPPYEGFKGVFLPHLLLYTTVPAASCAVLWYLLVRSTFLAPPPHRTGRDVIGLGLVGGIVALIIVLACMLALAPAGTIHWIDPQPWKIAGNVFSNFFEEFVYRGFLLAALSAVFGFWPAALISSFLWGMSHFQYPIPFRIMISVIGVYWCWLCRHAKSLLAPYTSHMVLDVAADSLIG